MIELTITYVNDPDPSYDVSSFTHQTLNYGNITVTCGIYDWNIDQKMTRWKQRDEHIRGVAPRVSMPSTNVLPALESRRTRTASGIFSHALNR
jgi:hypothetical protein